MKLSALTPEGTAALAVHTLGLDAGSVELTSAEALAASLRRAASFMCPSSPGRLVDAVLDAIRPVAGERAPTREDLAELLDLLVANGDVLELRHDSGGRSTRLLYLGPPTFIERELGTYLLMGVRPYGAPLLDEELAVDVEYEGHTRVLRRESGASELAALGLHQIAREKWVLSPRRETARDLVERLRGRLAVAAEPGGIDGLQILDPMSRPRFYKGRWRAPVANDVGDFVARRPQAYGADLWCFVRLRDGSPQRMLEFPIDDPVVPGRDEAWRLQAAIDSLGGHPQQFRVRPAQGARGEVTLDFFSPLPGFVERYLQLVGLALGKTTGALFSFRAPQGAIADVTDFLTDMVWMDQEEAAR